MTVWQPPGLNVDWDWFQELVDDGYDEVEAYRRSSSVRFPFPLEGGAEEAPQAAAVSPTSKPVPYHAQKEDV